MASKFDVTGDQYRIIDRRMVEIKRQLNQEDGSPLDPEVVAQSLQAIIEPGFIPVDILHAIFFTDAQALDRWASEVDGLKDMLESHRAIATEILGLGTEVKIVREVPRGFTIWQAPKLGPCYKDLAYMKDWDVPDGATRHCLAFFSPRLVPESTRKNVEEQMGLLAEIREKYNLPAGHLTRFGRVALLANLILSHHRHTNERIPLDCNWTRTDTRLPGGDRLDLGDFASDGLYCDYWHWDDERGSNLGCFALGVEELGS